LSHKVSPEPGSAQGQPNYYLVPVAQSAQTATPHFVGLPGQGERSNGQDSILKVEWAALNAQARPLNRSLPDYRRVL